MLTFIQKNQHDYGLSGHKTKYRINVLITGSSYPLICVQFCIVKLLTLKAVITFVAFDGIAERLLRIPYYPLGGTVSHFLQIKENYVFLIMSLLPSLIMWIGMMSKCSL